MKSNTWWVLVMLCLAACVQTPKGGEAGDASSALQRARIHTELANAYYGSGQYDIALEEVRIALEADKNYLPAVNQLGLVYLALGRTDDAKTELRRAIRIDPDDPSVNNNYGMLLCSVGNASEAMRYFNRALSDPLYRNPELAYVNAGVCLKNTGDYAGAEEFLRRAIAQAPDLPQALYHLADIKYQTGKYAEAKTFVTRHMQLVVPGPDALWLGARVERRMGDAVALEAYGAQLNRRFPDAPQTKAFNQGRFE